MQNDFDQSIAEALRRHRGGRFAEAEKIYQRLLVDHPGHPTPLNLYGALAVATGRFALAETLLHRAIDANPAEANYHNNHGEALRNLGRLDEAVAAYREAIRLNPKLATAHGNLGVALAAMDRLADAIAAYRTALDLQPDDASAWTNLGNALRRHGDAASAVEACSRATIIRPKNANLEKNLGAALAADQRFEEAVESYNQSLQSNANDAETLSNLCNALSAVGRDADAIGAGDRAVKFDPESVQAHWNLAVTLLRAGEWRRGWDEYEWRWKQTPMPFSQPLWDGITNTNQTVLFHAEQGFGDSIQFARFVPIAARKIHTRGGRVIIRVAPALIDLFKSLDGIDQIISTDDPVPSFDAHLPFMSLARILNVRPDQISGEPPYLWGTSIKIRRGTGVCFAGSATHNNDRWRSLAPEYTAPLLKRLRGVVSLHPKENPKLVNFAATAQIIAGLERVICVDTAVAHLAGALDVPVWILLPAVADWRWLRDENKTPWYPSARLFRQRLGESWTAVINRVIAALEATKEPG